ncbi:hypothetical protein [Nitratireductor sp. XY-223]|uniref:hypothetical protein n=1 Tax=Nitratireductor sp. XY-223 TaxID=2561926 RepID=UPI001FEE2211|nr:hypothetical protein [Nitratireductor sp. XY-223]
MAVLDGGWDRFGQDEDADAPRRLYYVAMTRARRTLTLARFQRPYGLQDALIGNSSVVYRKPVELPPNSVSLGYRHVRASLQDVDLGFAGRCKARDSVHGAIAALSPGDPLKVRISDSGRWQLLDRAGRMVGRLANGFKPPQGQRCRSAEVFAVVRWSREISDLKYRDSMKCDTWEAVVPELVFEPDEQIPSEAGSPGP